MSLITKGFDEARLRDMDHVSLVALYQEVSRQEALAQANQVALSATAAQGTGKGIKDTIDGLIRAGGERPRSDDLNSLLK